MKSNRSIVFTFILIAALAFASGCSSYWVCEGQACDTGKARLTTEYGDVYEGEVLKGRPHGFGTITYGVGREGYSRGPGRERGDKYVGNFGENPEGYVRYYGDGTLFLASGFAFAGTWANDRIQAGPGSMDFPDRKRVRGRWFVPPGNWEFICVEGGCKQRGIAVQGLAKVIWAGRFPDGRLERGVAIYPFGAAKVRSTGSRFYCYSERLLPVCRIFSRNHGEGTSMTTRSFGFEGRMPNYREMKRIIAALGGY